MFNKQSRYYKLENQAIENHDGFIVENKQLRYLPVAEGKVFYKLDAGDRIDHMAYKFFGRSKQWWHICDANPEFLSPRELLGETPLIHQALSLSFHGYAPQWSNLIDRLEQLIGVQEIILIDLPAQGVTYDSLSFIGNLPGDSSSELDASILLQTITPPLQAVFSAAGVSIGGVVRISKPNEGVWQVNDLDNQVIYSCLFIDNVAPAPDMIRICPSIITYSRKVDIIFNSNSIALGNIFFEIEAAGFVIDWDERIGRTGKKISVPSRYTG